MQRDLDLIRKILLKCEEREHGYDPSPFTIDGYTDEHIGFHIVLAGEAGLVHTTDITGQSDESPVALAHSITWSGYEFLDDTKDETVWKKAKKAAGNNSFDVLKAVLTVLATEVCMKAAGLK